MHASPVYHSRIHQSPIFRSLPGVSGGEVSTGALKFDGVDDYIDCGSPSAIDNLSSGNFCVSSWIKLGATPAVNYRVVDKNNGSAANGWNININSSRQIAAFTILSTTNVDTVTSTTLATNVWYHIVANYSATTKKWSIFINGVEAAYLTQTAGVGTVDDSANNLKIGGISGFARYFLGNIDDVRVYNVALSAAQIAALYANTTPAPTTGLVGHWKLDDGSGTTAVDSSGNGNNGTLTNGPTWQVQVPPRLSRNRLTEDWSVLFDGANDYIESPINGISNTSIWTVTWWQKQDLSITYPVPVSFGPTSGSRSFYFHVPYSGTNTYYSSRPSDRPTVAGLNGVWAHIAMVETGSQGKLYVNGILAGTFTGGTAGTINNGDKIFFSDWYYGVMKGNLKDVRLYNSALAQSDITKLCNGQESTAVPVVQWRLNDGSGTTAVDSRGSNNGTLTNGPTWSSQVPPWFVAA